MAMKNLRDSASGGLGKFFLFGFLVLAVGGLVLSDVGGFFRGGIRGSDIAVVGGKKISIQNFDSNLRRTLGRIGVSPQDAYRAGYVNQMLSSEIRTALMGLAAKDHGIRIGNEVVARQIRNIIEPYVQNGQNPKDILQQILMNQGMSEQVFTDSIAKETANNLLGSALNNGLATVSDAVAKDAYRYKQEKRDIQYIVYKNSELGDVLEPTEDQLRDLYNVSKESFAQAERRRFQLITIKNDALKKTIDISEEEIRKAYDDNIDLYTVNESRTLDQALLNTEEQAKNVVEALGKGLALKDAVKNATSQSSAYLGEKNFEPSDLIPSIKEQTLAADKNGQVIGPLDTPIGWYVIVVKSINQKKVKSFDEIKKTIRDEMVETRMIDEQYALANQVDDLFAGGVSLEDVAQQIDLDIQTLPSVSIYGMTKDNKDGFENHKDLKATILETGFQLEEGETSAVFETPDGSFAAVRLAELTPKAHKDFEDVEAELGELWMRDQTQLGNRMRVMGYLTDLRKNSRSLSSLADSQRKQLSVKKSIGRSEDPDGVINAASVLSIFAAPLHEPILVSIDDGVAIVEVTSYIWPEKIEEHDVAFKSFKDGLSATMQKDGLTAYLESKRQKYGAKINQPLLEKIYGPGS